MPEAPTLSPTAPPTEITRLDLFTGYLKIGLLGFAGVAPWSRKVIVEERQWLSEEDYAAILGFGQIFPDANTIDAAVIIGDRFHGASGSVIAVCASSQRPWPSWRPWRASTTASQPFLMSRRPSAASPLEQPAS